MSAMHHLAISSNRTDTHFKQCKAKMSEADSHQYKEFMESHLGHTVDLSNVKADTQDHINIQQ